MASDRVWFALPIALALAGGASSAQSAGQQPAGPFCANGIKIGDVTHTSARIWVRSTAEGTARHGGVPFPKRKPGEPQLPEGRSLDDMQGAVPGCEGEVSLSYHTDDVDGGAGGKMPPVVVKAETDFTHTFRLEGLVPGANYQLLVHVRPVGDASRAVHYSGAFRTAPLAEVADATSFCVIACQDYPRRDRGDDGHAIYEHMLALAPDFLIHTGDTLYYDKPQPFARDVATARFKWNRFYGLELPKRFHANVAAWFVKDDHDTLKNDCWPGQSYGELTFEQGLAIFREQNPVGPRSYRRQRYGRHLEVWLLEGREFRSPNRMQDAPIKTILGDEQKQWLKRTLAASTATFRVVASATPIVGPDRTNKNDNHANRGFAHEGDELRAFLAKQPGTIVVCGDRHWQYASHDPVTGLREWCCGAASDRHAGGYRLRDRNEQHDYLKICGGFLHVDVLLPAADQPARLRLRHRGVDGDVNHEDVLDAPVGR